MMVNILKRLNKKFLWIYNKKWHKWIKKEYKIKCSILELFSKNMFIIGIYDMI
jgi:hypothetical protein